MLVLWWLINFCSSVICLSLLLVFLIYLKFWWTHRHVLATANKLPCPPALYFIGNAHFFLGDVTSITKYIIKFTKEFKGLFSIWVGPVPLFVVSDPADVQIILNSSSTLEKDIVYNFLKPFMGNGLLTAPVTIWKRYRRLISPVFHPSNIEQYMDVFNSVSKDLVDKLNSGNGKIDPTNDIFCMALDAVMGSIFGRPPLSSHTKDDVKYLLDKGGRIFVERMFKVWLHSDFVYRLLHKSEMEEAMIRHRLCIDVIEEEWRDEENTRSVAANELETVEGNGFSRKNLIDVCFAHPEEEFKEHSWRDEITTMVVGATDTVVAALSFLLITLANHQEIQAKVLAEIDEVVGDSHDVTISDLNSLTYLNQVILESMRLHGTFPVILRRVTKDTKVSVCTLPVGSRVMIPLHAMGWHEDQFPHPEKFLPERFAPEEQQQSENKRHNYAFLPFSGGPRNCIGKSYAMLIMKTVMVHILRRYHVTSEVRLSDIEYELKVVMFSKTPLLMTFNAR